MEITRHVASSVLEVIDRGLSRGVGNPILGEMGIGKAMWCALGEGDDTPPPSVSSVLHSFAVGLSNARWSSNATRAKGLRRLAIAQLGTCCMLDERLFAEKLSKALITNLLPRALKNLAAAFPQPARKSELLSAAKRCTAEGTAAAATKAAEAAEAVVKAAAYAQAAAAAQMVAKVAVCAAYTAAPNAVYKDAEAKLVVYEAAKAVKYAAVAAAYVAVAAAADELSKVVDDASAFAAAFADFRAQEDAVAAAAADRLLGDFAEDVVQILVEMQTPGSKFLSLTTE